MGFERGIIDKMINGAFMGKREIGRPLKYNTRNRGRHGWIELLFNPRNQTEKFVSGWLRLAHPYLAHCTYRFHVEKCREIGIRIEDFYCQKFHKEPYIMNHVYAQYFHPENLLERVRDVSFYRRPRTLFKGFKVPDWATAENTTGWEVDAYSRQAWDNAMADMHSEFTPQPFFGERQEPNVLEWFRLEQFGKGASSRLFFNEVPQPWWHRNGGHLDDPEATLYSFTHADQESQINFGIDTTTPEGREQWQSEYAAISAYAPEIVPMANFVQLHEIPKFVTQEPHFQRVWQTYEQQTLRNAIAEGVASGAISAEDSAAAVKFLGNRNTLSVNQYFQAQAGGRPDLVGSDGYEATSRVFAAVGLGNFQASIVTAQAFDSQFWTHFDQHFNLTEISMREELPNLIANPANRMKVEAIIEETQKLSASQ